MHVTPVTELKSDLMMRYRCGMADPCYVLECVTRLWTDLKSSSLMSGWALRISDLRALPIPSRKERSMGLANERNGRYVGAASTERRTRHRTILRKKWLLSA